MTTIDDTGELRQLAEQLRRMEHDPRRPGGLDVMLLSISIGAGIIVGVCLLILTVAPQRYSVDPGRVVLTMAAAGICVAPVLAGLYGVNCMNRRRHQRTMEKLDSLGTRVRWDRNGLAQANGRTLSPSEYYQVYKDAMDDLGDIPSGDN